MTKHKRNTSTSEKIDDDSISKNCDIIVFFPVYNKFTAIRKLDSKTWSIKLTFSLIVTFYFTEP